MNHRSDACREAELQCRMGAAIRRARGALSQTQLGLLVDRPQSTVSTWENGKVPVDLQTVFRLESVLGRRRGTLLVEAGYVDAKLLRGETTFETVPR